MARRVHEACELTGSAGRTLAARRGCRLPPATRLTHDTGFAPTFDVATAVAEYVAWRADNSRENFAISEGRQPPAHGAGPPGGAALADSRRMRHAPHSSPRLYRLSTVGQLAQTRWRRTGLTRSGAGQRQSLGGRAPRGR